MNGLGQACIFDNEEGVTFVDSAQLLLEPGWARACLVVKDGTEHLHLLSKFELSGEPECLVLVQIDVQKAQIGVGRVSSGEER